MSTAINRGECAWNCVADSLVPIVLRPRFLFMVNFYP